MAEDFSARQSAEIAASMAVTANDRDSIHSGRSESWDKLSAQDSVSAFSYATQRVPKTCTGERPVSVASTASASRVGAAQPRGHRRRNSQSATIDHTRTSELLSPGRQTVATLTGAA
jgi:hypothetical protein